VSEADLIRDAAPLTMTAGSPVRLSAGAPFRTVAEVMTRQVVTVGADEDVEAAAELFMSSFLKSLPVLLRGQVVGVVSRRDLIHALATRDRRIRDEVLSVLRVESRSWSADVEDGVVCVTGPGDDHERRIAETLAGTVAGVVAVHVR
jgi:CBS domain-containing protein